MTHHRLCRPALLVLMSALLLASCGKVPPQAAAVPPPPKPSEAHVMMAVAPDTNPDTSGRPSPVVVRVYQLKGDAAFKSADFFKLFDEEEQTLGAELVSRREFVLAPSDLRGLDVALDPDTRFVGAVAAFRDIRNSQWRGLLPTWPEGLRHVTLAVERARIVISLQDPASEQAR